MGFQSIALGSGDGGTQVVDDIDFEFSDSRTTKKGLVLEAPADL